MECALLFACALRAAGPGPPWGPAGLGRLAKAGATTKGRAAQPGPGRRPTRATAHTWVSPFSLLQALQLCCLCCASVAVALASDSSSGGSGLNDGAYLPSVSVLHHPTRAPHPALHTLSSLCSRGRNVKKKVHLLTWQVYAARRGEVWQGL